VKRTRTPATAILVAAPAILAGAALTLLMGAGLAGCGQSTDASPSAGAKKVIVLGIDGMDYRLTKKLMDEGRLPNLKKLVDGGGAFSPLGTAVPPLSPVAWSDFITGLDAGGHGIYDFLHRDPETITPYFSTSRAVSKPPRFELGKYQIPGDGKIELLRHGTPFWQVLEERGIETAIFRMPANFPPSEVASYEITGMGTTDLQGTPGTFAFYTSELFAFSGQDISGGVVHEVDAFDNVVRASLYGPDNPFLREPEKVEAEFTVYLDPKEDVAKLVLGDEKRLLRVGEWTDWVPFEFPLVPTKSIPAMARFYLKQVHPEFELYVSPINADPESPAIPVSFPDDFAAELAHHTGRFYTQGMPEDTKALEGGVLDRDEFLQQAAIAGQEILDQYPYVLENFDRGLLFFYTGNIDQVSHMMWRTLDPGHPAYDPEADGPYADVIPKLYEEVDRLVGYTLEHMDPDTTLVVMSDHGFTSWRRSMNLNSWLRDNGFLAVKDPNLTGVTLYGNVDWSKTKAYGLGLNGLYINLAGREKNGIVKPGEREAVMRAIREKLLAAVDPATGEPPVTRVYFREETYDDRGQLEIGPDIQVGYGMGYHVSGDSALGELSPEVYFDNTDEWSGDHGNDHTLVPGVLLTSQRLKKPADRLENLAAAILAEFGVEGFPANESRDRDGDDVAP
jgi:predicted AlkP superfamily phosphohydrolase/phosphomutase